MASHSGNRRGGALPESQLESPRLMRWEAPLLLRSSIVSDTGGMMMMGMDFADMRGGGAIHS